MAIPYFQKLLFSYSFLWTVIWKINLKSQRSKLCYDPNEWILPLQARYIIYATAVVNLRERKI